MCVPSDLILVLADPGIIVSRGLESRPVLHERFRSLMYTSTKKALKKDVPGTGTWYLVPYR